MWYMYQPRGGIAVPLAEYTWDLRFEVTATRKYFFTSISYTVTVSGAPQSASFDPTTMFPTWTVENVNTTRPPAAEPAAG
jgi:hypothetical protein